MKAKKRIMKTFKNILLIALIIFLSIIGYYAYLGYEMHKEAITRLPPEQIAEALRRDNFVTMDELPEYYIKAVICAEDRRFYHHNGVDLKSVARAIAHDIKTLSFEQGGSTITQQLVKNTYYTQEKRLERKFAEVFTALEVEKNLSKDDIFELYVNTIYFGSGYYGIYEAAYGYYGKNPSELTDNECAMLAGIPNAPSAYSLSDNPDLAHQRMEQVLECIAECEEENNMKGSE